MQSVQFPTWVAIVLLAAPPVATFLGALIGQWVASRGASQREEATWKRSKQERMIEIRTNSYGELLAAAHHWLQEMQSWAWFLVVDEGFEPTYTKNREEIEKRMREAAASVVLMAPKKVAELSMLTLHRLIDCRDKIDYESEFPANRPQMGTDTTRAVQAVERLEAALRADLETLLDLPLD